MSQSHHLSRRAAWLTLALAAVLHATPWPAAADRPLAAVELTLEEALRTAAERSPRLPGACAEIAQAQGRLRQSRLFPFNPILGVEAARRHGLGDSSSTDRSVSLSQEIEIAGQRGRRVAAAGAELSSRDAAYRRERQVLAADVRTAYAEAVLGRDLLRIQEQDTELARHFAAYATRRFEAGAASQIESNFARAALGRAERELLLAAAAYREAQARLAESIGLGAVRPIAPVGEAPMPEADLPPLEPLLRTALEIRPDLAALRHAVVAAEGRRRLAGSEALPNMDVEAFYGREEGGTRLAGVGVSVGIPVFNRNQGRVLEAVAERAGVEAEVSAAALAVERELVAAHARLAAAVTSATGLREAVVGSLDENLELLERSFDVGKIGATELVLFRRDLVEGRRDYIQALADAWQARISLDLAVGALTLPESTEE
jgi:cobalt-zinc-cadmium efflux system outer membrane protein